MQHSASYQLAEVVTMGGNGIRRKFVANFTNIFSGSRSSSAWPVLRHLRPPRAAWMHQHPSNIRGS